MTDPYEKKRAAAVEQLLVHARKNSKQALKEISAWPGIVKHEVEGRGKVCLPGYIPYVGSHYFNPHTKGRRILVYALSQNIREKDNFAITWATDWHQEDGKAALDRQNRAYRDEKKNIAIKPFDTGHLPILCGIIRNLHGQGAGQMKHSIYTEIAATNLSKFSFRSKSNRTKDNDKSLENCFEWFSRTEVEILKPNFILCAGNRAHRILKSKLGKDSPTKLLKITFPSSLVINRHFKKGAATSGDRDSLKKMFSPNDLERKMDFKRHHTLSSILDRDAYYFVEMKRRLEEQLQRTG